MNGVCLSRCRMLSAVAGICLSVTVSSAAFGQSTAFSPEAMRCAPPPPRCDGATCNGCCPPPPPPPARCDANVCNGCVNTHINCSTDVVANFNDGIVDPPVCVTAKQITDFNWLGTNGKRVVIGTEVGYGSQQSNHGLHGGVFWAAGSVGDPHGPCITSIRLASGVNLTLVCAHMRMEGDGCFDPATRILKADGSIVRADEVRTGDRLYSPTRPDGVEVLKVREGPESKALLRISTAAGSIVVTKDHPFAAPSGFVRASDLRIGDPILDANQSAVEVLSSDEYGPYPGQTVVNFVLEAPELGDGTAHLLVAEGLLSGDLVVQKAELSTKEQ